VTNPALHESNYNTPHHFVFRPSCTSTKLQVVFDASFTTTSQLSLNDLLLVGPTVQTDLYLQLLKFRLFQYAMTADVTKMYRQVLVDRSFRKYQYIFWREYRHLRNRRCTVPSSGQLALFGWQVQGGIPDQRFGYQIIVLRGRPALRSRRNTHLATYQTRRHRIFLRGELSVDQVALKPPWVHWLQASKSVRTTLQAHSVSFGINSMMRFCPLLLQNIQPCQLQRDPSYPSHHHSLTPLWILNPNWDESVPQSAMLDRLLRILENVAKFSSTSVLPAKWQ